MKTQTKVSFERLVAQTLAVVFIAMLGTTPGFAVEETTPTETKARKDWPDPKRFEKAIADFNTTEPAPKGAIVAYGSSSIRGWHKTIQEDLAPMTVVPRGFGGSNINDALYYMDQVVIPLKPRAVLLYEGDNDVAGGYGSPAELAAKFQEFAQRLHAAVPSAHLFILSIKPSPSRWKLWPVMKETNDLLKKFADDNPKVTYIDIATPMLNDEGQPREELFLKDRLHMTRKGYEIWRDAVRLAITN